MSAHCRWRWAAEAARDGRIVGRELRSFEVHSQSCRDCRTERRAIDRLAQALVEASPVNDEVSLRRGRERLLASADAWHRRPTNPLRARIVLAAALVAMLGAWSIFGTARRATPQSSLSVTASAGAKWERHLRKGVDEIVLSEGTLGIVVARSPNDPRVAVRVPDGEIEDIGTAFRVTVRDGLTRRILVEDGAVVFYRSGKPSALVASGSVWSMPAEPVAVHAPAVAPIEPPSVAPPVTVTPRVNARPVASLRAPATRGVEPVAPSPDPTAEDAAYLRIVALQRDHRIDEARAAAADYLTDFPDGFRRAEVLRFALRGR